MELKGLRKRWKERREAYERREREIEKESSEKLAIDTSSDDSSSYPEPIVRIKKVCTRKSDVRKQYAKLQESSTINAIDGDNHDSLLLPSFVRPCENLKVFVKGASDTMQKRSS